MTRPTRTLVCLLLGLLYSSGALAYPQTDAIAETVIVGPKVQTTDASKTVGRWNVAPQAINARPRRARTIHLWWSTHPQARLTDGLIRARIEVKDRFNAVLLLRHRESNKTSDPSAHSGYGVSLGRRGMKLYRYDAGVPRSISRRIDFEFEPTVELVAFMVGPNISVTVFSGKTLRPLATLVASDRTYSEGSVGLRIFGRRASQQRLTFLAIRRAHKKGSRSQAPPTSGVKRFLELARRDLARLDPTLRDELVSVAVADLAADRVVVVADAPSHERLSRTHVPYQWRDLGTSFRMRSREYRARIGKPVVATPQGFRIDHSYKDPDMVEALLSAYAKRFPKLTRLVQIGTSRGGRPIVALKVSDNPGVHEGEPAVLLNGSHHGNELLPVEFVFDAIQQLLENYATSARHRRWVDELELWLVPLVNPDGNWNFMRRSIASGRKNGRDSNENGRFDYTDGVDLNRNYPFRWGALGELGSHSNPRLYWYRGPRPASEPETRAMMRLTDSEHFVAAISYHTVSTVILAPYTTNQVTNPLGHVAREVAEDIAKQVPRQPNRRRMRVKKQIYPVDGVDQDHFMAAHGTVALLVEGAYHNPGPKRRKATVEATRATWTALLDRVLDGPRISGRVLDPEGRPVSAQVKIQQNAPQMGEIWTSRCRDGRFDRLLNRHLKTVVMEVSAPGYQRRTLELKPATTHDVTVVLKPTSQPTKDGPREKFCGDPALLSADHFCACQQGRCLVPGAAETWCVKDGVCHARGTPECSDR